MQVGLMDVNLSHQHDFSEGVGRANRHIRFNMEDLDLSKYSDSIDNLGVDQRLKKQRRKEKQRSKMGKIEPRQLGVPKCLQLVESVRIGRNKRRHRVSQNSGYSRGGTSRNVEE